MKVLFIGNSYTYYNDMPRLFEALACENGHNISVDSVTRGGRKLYENLNAEDENHKTIKTLCSLTEYDVLFLQEHSISPISSYSLFEDGATGLVAAVGAKRNVLYCTWARKDGSPTLADIKMTRDEMSAALVSAYTTLASRLSAEISNVGLIFDKIYSRHPNIELYASDLTHPSYVGSAVAAIVHYNTVFGRLPDSLTTLNLDKETANIILNSIRT